MVNCDSCLNKNQCIVCKDGFQLAFENKACYVAGTIANISSENNNSSTESESQNSITKDTQTATAS